MKKNINTIIIALGVIISSIILGGAWKRTHMGGETISVTGLASKDFTSDLIVWGGSFTAESVSTKEAYAQIKKDAEVIKKYLISKGLKEKEIVFSAVRIDSDYEYINKNGTSVREFKGYVLTQNLTVESKEVNKVENISREVSELIEMGVDFYSSAPDYYYTKLSELKIEMLSLATADARTRAETIATNAKGSLGSLRRADMGIFQITGQNSSEDFTYGGVFNTSSKEKTASVTVHLDFYSR
jgi:uncharacterized protein